MLLHAILYAKQATNLILIIMKRNFFMMSFMVNKTFLKEHLKDYNKNYI